MFITVSCMHIGYGNVKKKLKYEFMHFTQLNTNSMT